MKPAATKRDEASISITSESSFYEVVTIEDEEEDQHDESDFGEASRIEASDIDPLEFIVQFKAWLKSADRGNLDTKMSKQHGNQIFKLLKVIDSKQKRWHHSLIPRLSIGEESGNEFPCAERSGIAWVDTKQLCNGGKLGISRSFTIYKFFP